MSEVLDISGAKRILVPKGDDNRACISAFEAETGIEVPSFSGRKLSSVSGGREFWLVKGKDVPVIVDGGYADAGLTGYDSLLEYPNRSNLGYQRLGKPMCRFVLLAPEEKATRTSYTIECGTQRGHGSYRAPSLRAVTAFPNMLGMICAVQDLPVMGVEVPINGSIEAMPSLIGCDLVADLVSSGETARANGLVEVESLMDIYPTIVTRVQS